RLRGRGIGARARPSAIASVEPTLGVGDAETDRIRDGAAAPGGGRPETGAAATATAAIGPGNGGAGESAGAAAQPDPAVRQPQLSEVCDCIVELVLPQPQAGVRLLQHTRAARLAGSKPILFEGASAEDASWRPLSASGLYRRVRAGILLANRHGPLNAMEFSEFVSCLQPLAESFEALLDTPDMSVVLERARELDQRCADLDAQVGVNVDVDEALGVDDLAGIATALGMSERGNNRFARLGADGEVLFSLALGDAANRLTFLLDVPRAPVDAMPWTEMVGAARDCAQAVGGRLVDDDGSALGEPAFAHIAAQLTQRYASLEAAGFPAGSAVALRLFN
ncbi:MAG: hypothetical protein JSW68_11990, partial [Burkholderiales bacterium]